MKTLYYCMGGGLGHITRFSAFCNTRGIRPLLATNCEAVKSGLIKVNAEQIFFPEFRQQQNKIDFQGWIRDLIKTTAIQRLIIDSFPAGILGELADLKELHDVECHYLVRILKMSVYMTRVDTHLPTFSRCYILEDPLPQQHEFINKGNCSVIDLQDLLDPPLEPDREETAFFTDNTWLIIHSGNNDELEQLWQFAEQTAELRHETPDILLISPGQRPDFLPAACRHLPLYPAHHLLNKATRVFSAAGFNIMRQMRNKTVAHHAMPFTRALDDQFYRASLQQQKKRRV